MAHVAIAARLESLAARDRKIAAELQMLGDATGSLDDALSAIIEAHRELAAELESVADRNRRLPM